MNILVKMIKKGIRILLNIILLFFFYSLFQFIFGLSLSISKGGLGSLVVIRENIGRNNLSLMIRTSFGMFLTMSFLQIIPRYFIEMISHEFKNFRFVLNLALVIIVLGVLSNGNIINAFEDFTHPYYGAMGHYIMSFIIIELLRIFIENYRSKKFAKELNADNSQNNITNQDR